MKTKYENAFDDYVSSYDLNEKRIRYKYHHSYKVEELINDEKLRKKYHVSGKVGRIIEFSTTNKGVTLFGLLLGRGDQFDHQYVRFEDIESLILE